MLKLLVLMIQATMQVLTSIITEIVLQAPALMMQIMIPLAFGAQEIAWIVRECVATVIDNVLHGPANCCNYALTCR